MQFKVVSSMMHGDSNRDTIRSLERPRHQLWGVDKFYHTNRLGRIISSTSIPADE